MNLQETNKSQTKETETTVSKEEARKATACFLKKTKSSKNQGEIAEILNIVSLETISVVQFKKKCRYEKRPTMTSSV